MFNNSDVLISFCFSFENIKIITMLNLILIMDRNKTRMVWDYILMNLPVHVAMHNFDLD